MLINLDKIILRRTVIGILCPYCDGPLEKVVVKRNILQWLGYSLKLKMRYRCNSCNRHYKMSEL